MCGGAGCGVWDVGCGVLGVCVCLGWADSIGSVPLVDRGHLGGVGVCQLREFVHLLRGAVGEALGIYGDLRKRE